MGRILALVLLAAAGAAAWWFGPDLLPRLGLVDDRPATEAGDPQPSPEIAERALDRVEAFRGGAGSDRLALGDLELSSVVRYALPGIVPPGVADPTVTMEDGKVHLAARVAVDAFPDLPSLRDVVGILPDTVDIEIRGSLVPHDPEHAALYVESVRAMRIPLPDRYVPDILRALGRRDQSGLPRQAMLVPIPDGLESVYVLQDSLILVADR